MNILLVYPHYPDTFWSLRHTLKIISKKAAFPPLGLLTVGSMLPQDWNKKLIDMNVTPLTDTDIKWADYVFVSAMVVQRESVKEVGAEEVTKKIGERRKRRIEREAPTEEALIKAEEGVILTAKKEGEAAVFDTVLTSFAKETFIQDTADIKSVSNALIKTAKSGLGDLKSAMETFVELSKVFVATKPVLEQIKEKEYRYVKGSLVAV